MSGHPVMSGLAKGFLRSTLNSEESINPANKPEEYKMKNRPSVFLMGLASVATAAYFTASAVAQTPATTPPPSVPPSAPSGFAATPPPGNGNNMPAPGMAYGVSEV